MKLFDKLDAYMDWFIFERAERRILKNGVIKLSKKHDIKTPFLEMYQRIQNRIMDELSIKLEPKNAEAYYAQSLLLGRIFEINLEFIQNMQKEFYHSANAMTRQMIEIYQICSLLNVDKNYISTFLGKDNRDIPKFKEIRDLMNKTEHIPNIKEVSKDKFFKSLDATYSFYSGIFHPKTESFMQNLIVCDVDKEGNWINTRPYSKNSSKTNVAILLFPKKTPFHPEFLKRMIHEFYTYTGFALDELDILKAYAKSS